jgi:malate permease and related proteins
MINFILIAICIIAGVLFRLSNKLPPDSHKGINAWLIYLALPAVSFKYLPHIQWSTDLIVPVFAPLVVWMGGWVFSKWYGKRNGLSTPQIGAMKLATGLSNTSFLGFPLVMAYFSDADIATAVICDQANFMLLSTIGITVAVRSAGKANFSTTDIAKKVLLFPPLIGCVAALTLPHFLDLTPIYPLFDKIASTIGPLALFSIGLQLQIKGWKEEIKSIPAALIYKLVLAPGIIFLIAMALKLNGRVVQITIFEMAMPSLISAGVIANDYGLNPKFTTLTISIGIVLCFITTGLWFLALHYFQ